MTATIVLNTKGEIVMSRHRIRIILCFIFCTILFATLIIETSSAQLIRRQLRRIPGFPTAQPGYRVAPLEEQPLIQGDGRILERVRNIVNLFTEGGAELKPVAVVSLTSFEEFKRVLQLVAKEIRLDKNSVEEPVLLNAFLAVYERIVGQGFDTTQPLGLILQTDGILYYPLFFTPLHLESKLGQSFKKDYTEQLPDGRYVIRQDVFNWPLGRLYVRQYNGWLFIASEQQLNSLPNDPTVLLQGLDKKHLMAAKFDLQNMPSLTTRAALSLGEMQAVAQAENELEKAATRLGIGYLRSLAEEADFLEYTVSYDEETADYIIEQKEIVKPNTERAKLLQERRNAKSPFHAFYHPEKAVLASHFVMNLTQSQRKELETIFDESLGKYLLTEEERLELKKRPQAEQKTQRKRRVQESPAELRATLSATKDQRDRLAELLSLVPQEQLEQEMNDESEDKSNDKNEVELEGNELADIMITKTTGENLTDVQKLEIIFRRIGVAYYWALIGAVRSGKFDSAVTCSFEHGILGVYNIVEGQKFREAFDSIFADLEKEFPEVYARNVRKDYVTSEGFSLTSVTFRPNMFIKNRFLSWLIPKDISERETRFLFGVRNDAVCFAVGQEELPEKRLLAAIAGIKQSLPVDDLFFTFSAYELGLAFAQSGNPNRFTPLKIVAANTNPNARAYAVSTFTDTSKTLTLRVSALLTPSLWRFRENLRDARSYR
jgi:hypothetical protein